MIAVARNSKPSGVFPRIVRTSTCASRDDVLPAPLTDDPRVGKRESSGDSQVLPEWQVNELISPLGGFATSIQMGILPSRPQRGLRADRSTRAAVGWRSYALSVRRSTEKDPALTDPTAAIMHVEPFVRGQPWGQIISRRPIVFLKGSYRPGLGSP
jgi:hypothetical protein